MGEFVKCWHCINYIWSYDKDDNSFARCDIKNQFVYAYGKVCKHFVLREGLFTKKNIPDYCIHYIIKID